MNGPRSPHGRERTGHIPNTSSENSGNSGSQYALCALGVGLVALGIVMIVWSVVPPDMSPDSGSSNTSPSPDWDSGSRKNKASSVAFVLVGSGVAMLLLSLCLGMRNKQREQQRLQEAQNHRAAAATGQEDREMTEEQARQFAVPSYEEAVGSGQYPVSQDNPRPSTCQLPSYEDLVQVDRVQIESEDLEAPAAGAQSAPAAGAQSAPTAAASVSGRRPGKNNRKLLPIKIRRIKSEKLRMKNGESSQPAAGISIEPLTPPPQYDKIPPI